MNDTIVGVIAVVGAAFIFVAGIGVVRFPDLYTRMHAATKASTVGIGLICAAGAMAIDHGTAKIVLAAVAIFVTAPTAAHLIGRAAYHDEHVDMRLDGVDDLAALLADDHDGAEPDPREG
ncbi:monovalent cation/H(+) antiporter subunit G [Desertimonas flava]|uniref:monovalent cation/H(+) antiporter subunit G n=1 Tax=Desertimonas flava TaxID=2064846 RepID=UPI001968E11C|nr:monovalent cation/H(+) antiporter subunit G [Desertimonas flava]